MAKQTINIGSTANDGTGSTLRVGGDIINDNFNEIYTASTGVIGEQLDTNKIINGLKSITSCETQSWFQAAHAIKTTDTFPKVVMRTCKIDGIEIDIVGITKGSGMIAPDMATMLGFIFTNANLHSDILQRLLAKANETSFNSITVDSDTSTNDMVAIFATGKAKNSKIYNVLDPKLQDFEKALHRLALNLSKQIVVDGEGAKKFITIKVIGARSTTMAKNIGFSIANSPLFKTAVAGEDPNWGRIIMAIGKAGPKINLKKFCIKLGNLKIVQEGKLYQNYSEEVASKYMKKENIEISVEVYTGTKDFTAYTMDSVSYTHLRAHETDS